MSAPDDMTGRAIGQVEGRLAALEARVDRHETAMGTILQQINAKLDQVQTTIAQQAGAAKFIKFLLAAVTGLAGIIGFVLRAYLGSL